MKAEAHTDNQRIKIAIKQLVNDRRIKILRPFSGYGQRGQVEIVDTGERTA